MPAIYQETDQAILQFLETWIRLLADNKTEEALNLIRNPLKPRSDYGWRKLMVNLKLRQPIGPFRWTKQTVESLIAGYGAIDNLDAGIIVTNPDTAGDDCALARLRIPENEVEVYGAVHEHYPLSVYWHRELKDQIGYTGYAHLDYPLNGSWSDLSSEFHLFRTEAGIEIELERIEVM